MRPSACQDRRHHAAGSAVDVAMRAMLRKQGLEDKRDLGFLKGPIDVQKYADLNIVREAAQRLK